MLPPSLMGLFSIIYFLFFQTFQVVEGSSEYKLLYHDLVSKFLNKLLNLAQDVVLSFKQVLNLLDSPVPQTFRYFFTFCIFLQFLSPASTSSTRKCSPPT